MATVDVIVAGAGIIGLSTAMELARNGLRVSVLEKGLAMREASWAAAGMLATNDPEHPAALKSLAILSGQLYPQYLRTVEELSGVPVPLRTRQTLVASSKANGASPNEHGSASYAIDAGQANQYVPGLATEGRAFQWIEEASLDPRDLCAALPVAAAAAGVDLQQETPVVAITSQANSVAVTTARGTLHAGEFVNCCGAWTEQVRYGGRPGLQAGPRIEPRKGQMLTVQLPSSLEISCVVRTPEVYLVPRGDGKVVIGATVERAGFDRRLDPEAIERLRGLAAEIWPPIASAELADSWSGMRPGTPDDLPYIGKSAEAHCWVAAGHFRNGILLAPGTALLVQQLLAGSRPAIDLAAFDPAR